MKMPIMKTQEKQCATGGQVAKILEAPVPLFLYTMSSAKLKCAHRILCGQNDIEKTFNLFLEVVF